MSEMRIETVALAALLMGAGAAHLIRPAPFDAIVPPMLPGSARSWTKASGIAELACGASLLSRRTRPAGARWAAALFVAVLPANAQMAWDHRHDRWPVVAVLLLRLPLQIPLVRWARRVADIDRSGPKKSAKTLTLG